jgi:hypothetical protein
MLAKYKTKYRNAADAVSQTAAAPAAVAAAAARSPWCSQDFNGVSEWQDDDAAAHQTDHSDLTERLLPSFSASKSRPDTLRKCEKILDCAISLVKQRFAKGMPLSRISVRIIARAYAEAASAAFAASAADSQRASRER